MGLFAQGHRVENVADNLSPKQRSALMSKIKGAGTGLELSVFRALRRNGVRFCTHEKRLPGRPDIVFWRARVVVFIEGDFWHGWQYPRWRTKLSAFWREKIEKNRHRDQLNIRRLRRSGWTVVRLWEHNLEKALSPGISYRPSTHAARSRRLSAVARWTLRSKYA